MVNILQSLVSQSGGADSTQQQKTTELMSHPALSSVFGGQAQPHLQTAQDSYIPQQRTALLDTPKQARPTLLGEPPCYQQTAAPPKEPAGTVVANNLNNLLNAQNLSQLLGSLSGNSSSTSQQQQQQQLQRPVLLGDRPPPQSKEQQQNSLQQQQPQQAALLPMPSVAQLQHQQPTLTTAGMTAGVRSQQVVSPDINPYLLQQQQFTNPYLMPYPSMAQPPPLPPTSVSYAQAQPNFLYGAPPVQAFQGAGQAGIAAQAPPSIYGVQQHTQQLQQQQQAFSLPPHSMAAVTSASTLGAIGSPVGVSAGGQFHTPQAQKRKITIPPSPEDSPQGGYIGQHSQGIGGHYADSYWRQRAPQGGAAKRQRF